MGSSAAARVFCERVSVSERQPCASGDKGVDCLHVDVEGLQPVTTKSGYQNQIELLQGTLDMLILKTLQWGERHGYGISQAIRTNSGKVLQVETGSLYPALHRLERQGWSRPNGRKARAINGQSSTRLRGWARNSWLPTMSVGAGWSRLSRGL